MLNFQSIFHDDQSKWVVFLHGAGGSIQTWNYQVEDFKWKFNLLLIDLRDHGQSKNIVPAFSRYRFELVSGDIREVLDHVGVDKAHFVTMSFGSVLLQDFSMRYPDMVDKSIISGGIFRGTWPIRMFAQVAWFLNLFLSYPSMYRLFSYLVMPKKRNRKARRLYQIQARKLTRQEYMKWIGLHGEFFKLLKRFYHNYLDFKTLVIMGSDDYIFLKSARSFVALQPGAHIIELPDTGHVCNIESPVKFNRSALAFLSS